MPTWKERLAELTEKFIRQSRQPPPELEKTRVIVEKAKEISAELKKESKR